MCLCFLGAACEDTASPGMTVVDLPGGGDTGDTADIAGSDSGDDRNGRDPGSDSVGECESQGDCFPGMTCLDNSCVPGCRSNLDCPEILYCDLAMGDNGWCVPCLFDNHCPDSRICLDRRCVVDCDTVECPTDKSHCDPGDGECVACLETADCPRDHLCQGRSCVPGCSGDDDCRDGWHCLIEAADAGRCVACFMESHCPRDHQCIAANCVKKGCVLDDDCGSGKYCHPLLRECLALPSKPCARDADCLVSKCDPLTRTCIAACVLGGCLDTSKVCVDGGCYGCGTTEQCPGTACSQLNRTCVSCRSDDDCVAASWHCETATGACHECLSDEHCESGHCDMNRRACIECREDQDCKDPGRPVCAKSGKCQAGCSSECSIGDPIRCDPNDKKEPIGIISCGDWDDDPCMEWGNPRDCGPGQSCSNNVCECVVNCTLDKWSCKDIRIPIKCRRDSASGCLYWFEAYPCASNEICDSGACRSMSGD
jgi:hypothetical protein